MSTWQTEFEQTFLVLNLFNNLPTSYKSIHPTIVSACSHNQLKATLLQLCLTEASNKKI